MIGRYVGRECSTSRLHNPHVQVEDDVAYICCGGTAYGARIVRNADTLADAARSLIGCKRCPTGLIVGDVCTGCARPVYLTNESDTESDRYERNVLGL